jgi:hypothetical protein
VHFTLSWQGEIHVRRRYGAVVAVIEGPDGTRYRIERRLPPLSWRVRLRETDWIDPFELMFDDVAGLALIPLLLLASLALAILIPLLVFVLEVALIVAVVAPLALLAIAVGLRRHVVVLVRDGDRQVVVSRPARGVIASRRAGRALAAQARAGQLPAPTR